MTERMSASVRALRKAAAKISAAETNLREVNAVLESKQIDRFLKGLGKAQVAIAEIAKTAPEIVSEEQATEVQEILGVLESELSMGEDFSFSDYAALKSRRFRTIERLVTSAANAIDEADIEGEWQNENPVEDFEE